MLPLRELTAAILLVVEVILSEQLVPTLLKASLPPVLGPEGGPLDSQFCLTTSPFYLLQTLPTAGSQRRRKILNTKTFRFLSGSLQSKREALFAASAPFRLSLQTADALQPMVVVVVAIDPPDTEALSMALTLVLADLVFLKGEDVRIIIEDGGAHVVGQHPLHNGG